MIKINNLPDWINQERKLDNNEDIRNEKFENSLDKFYIKGTNLSLSRFSINVLQDPFFSLREAIDYAKNSLNEFKEEGYTEIWVSSTDGDTIRLIYSEEDDYQV